MRRLVVVFLLIEAASVLGFTLVLQAAPRATWPLPAYLAFIAGLNLLLLALAMRRRRSARTVR